VVKEHTKDWVLPTKARDFTHQNLYLPRGEKNANSFAHKLAKVALKLPNGHEIEVKMLKDTLRDGKKFINEVDSISRTSHVNVVAL
jgi:hypothetical protein